MARISLLFLLFGLLFTMLLPGQTAKKKAVAGPAEVQPAEPVFDPKFPLTSITVEGNKILPAEGIAKASGLQLGQKGDKAAFDLAQARLVATGYFETVAYRFRSMADGSSVTVTFEVQEIQPLLPLRIEGLVEKPETILAAIRRVDPLFTGKLPGTQQVLDRTAREIEQYLAEQNHPDKISGKVVALTPGTLEIQFQPARGLTPVAEISFEGNKAISNTDLVNAISSVAYGQPYTESLFRQLLENQVRPRYEAKGYLQVKFSKVVTEPSTTVKGVDIKVTVEEGPVYKLNRVAVAGKMAEDSKRILKTAKLPEMTVANFDEIRDASLRVREEMRHRGFLLADVTIDRKLDEGKRTVDVWIVIETGPEYTFGKLTVLGLGLDGEAAIRKMWALKDGEAFQSEYPDYFLSKVKEEGVFDNLGDTKAIPKRDDKRHVVDVTLDFKYSAPKVKKPGRPGIPE